MLACATGGWDLLAQGRVGAAPTETSLRGAGSTFSATLYKQWIETYHQAHPEISISYDAVGSGEGVRRFVAGSVDFGASDVALSDQEASEVPRGTVMVASTAGMVVLAYNLPGVRGELKLPRDVPHREQVETLRDQAVHERVSSHHIGDEPVLNRIATAFEQLIVSIRVFYRVKSDVGTTPESRRQTLVSASRTLALSLSLGRTGSGTTFALTNHLAAVSLAWREQGLGVGKLVEWPASAMSAIGNEGVASRIKISEGCRSLYRKGDAAGCGPEPRSN